MVHFCLALRDSESPSLSSAPHKLDPIIIAAILWGHEGFGKSILIHIDTHDHNIITDSLFLISEIQTIGIWIGIRIGFLSNTSLIIVNHNSQQAPQLRNVTNASQEAILNSFTPSTLSAHLLAEIVSRRIMPHTSCHVFLRLYCPP